MGVGAITARSGRSRGEGGSMERRFRDAGHILRVGQGERKSPCGVKQVVRELGAERREPLLDLIETLSLLRPEPGASEQRVAQFDLDRAFQRLI